jgi:hypothetical protein
MKSISLLILMAISFSPAAYPFGIDPGVVSREISASAPTYNNQQNNSSQPYVIIYQDPASQKNIVTIDRKNKVKRN